MFFVCISDIYYTRLGKAIGNADRIALSRLAIRHLEVTKRPIRVAVDISIWLFQLQAGRGGQNPELRTLFFRLIRLLALPVHPLFVYDGKQKPPFKRGKATTGRSYGSAPIIGLSKILIDLFRFPRHDAPGEAEAECARLQQSGVVDAVMSNDVDTLMFGSGLTIMNYSKESSTGTTAATHVDCYTTRTQLDVEANVKLSRAGMILFAMLSGGDYLPSGVTKCGPSLAGEIAKAGFGEDLLEIIYSKEDEIDIRLREWRERLQYELDENESGYFQCKHKAVRIPETFPDRQILSFYAKPIVSSAQEIQQLQQRLAGAWDNEINALELRKFVADFFDWKYRSGAKKLIRNLAEPLILTRLRLSRSPIAMLGYGAYVPNTDLPALQRIYRSRMHFSTGCVPQVQLEMIPVDIVGLDLDAEEPNPPPECSQVTESGSQPVEDEDETDAETGQTGGPAPKFQLSKKPYDPFEPEKIWVFETVANIGIPKVVERWKMQEAEKKMPKKPVPKRTTTAKKKKVIDPGMKPGGILRYTTVTKPGSDMNNLKKAHLIDATSLAPSSQQPSSQGTFSSQLSASSDISQSQSGWRNQKVMKYSTLAVDELAGQFSVTCSITDESLGPVGSPRLYTRHRLPVRGVSEFSDDVAFDSDLESHSPSQLPSPAKFKLSYTAAESLSSPTSSPLSISKPRRSRRIKAQQSEDSLETALESLSLSSPTQGAGVGNQSDSRKLKNTVSKLPNKPSASPPLLTTDGFESDDTVSSHNKRTSLSLRNRKNQLHAKLIDEHTNHEPIVSESVKSNDENRGQDQSLPQSRETLSETIRTYKGFWTVEFRKKEEATSSETSEMQLNIKEDVAGNEPKKKRIARVSLLDMR